MQRRAIEEVWADSKSTCLCLVLILSGYVLLNTKDRQKPKSLSEADLLEAGKREHFLGLEALQRDPGWNDHGAETKGVCPGHTEEETQLWRKLSWLLSHNSHISYLSSSFFSSSSQSKDQEGLQD